MKKDLYIFVILFIVFGNIRHVYSQQISINSNVSIQQLIEDNLVEGCVEISNVTSSVNGTSSGFSSYAEFNRGSSNFPFENGIMLSTGNAESGGNTINTSTLSEGANGWGTDPDLETALGITSTENATSIEFDFISISNQVSFNYLFASEEYFGVFPCQRADGFAFLIKETGSAAPYQNIALVPGTSTPVNTSTIRDEIVGLNNCPAQNNQYFDGYNLGDTNYNGRTTVLTASAPITPYVQYHIKLVIADQGDRTWDSAVFIEGDSFKILDLGDDITTCATSVTLDANINNPTSTYEWFFNNSSTPIPNETNPTLVVTQSGNYKVEITNQLNNNSDCIEEDDIQITLSSEESISPIDDYFVCDDLSGDEIEIFNLSTKDSELASVIPFINYSHSYHYTNIDARNNVNPISSSISNTTNPQEVFVRIQDLDSGCFAYTSFNLVVNTIPDIVDPTDLDTCDADSQPDGRTSIDLTQKNDEITNGDPNYQVSYHFTNSDAENGNNPIPSPNAYTNTNTTDNLFVRIVNSSTGCINTSNLTVNITTSPVVNRDTQFLDACDSDHDGSASFDLTEAISDILNGLPASSVTVTFHESYDEANQDINPIANEDNYQNLVPDEQLIFVRIEDNITGCASITFLEIHSNLLLTGTDTGDFALCDDESGDGIINFNLSVIEVFIANDLDNIVVNFFEDQNDLDNNNPLNKNQIYPVDGSSTLLVTIDNGSCSEVADVTLRVDPILQFPVLTSAIPYCDNDDDPDDGTVSVEMATFDEIITNSNPDFSVRYFPSDLDARSGTNQFQPFHDVSGTLEVFTRIEHNDTQCSSYGSFEIEIILSPTITEPTPFLICDDDDDGFFPVNLEDKISEITSTPSLFEINFFTTINDAEDNLNSISLTDRINYNTSSRTVFVRVENTASGCYDIANLEIIVNTLPEVNTIEDFKLCEDDGDNQTQFRFSEKDSDILNNQIGKEVLYFEDSSFTIPIDKNVDYTNLSSPQTIHVKIQNITDPDCFVSNSFSIRVEANPVYTVPGPFLECDDPTNDGLSVFDLNEKIDEINQSGLQNNNITFHLTLEDAEDNINEQPLQFNNTLNPQTLFARIENSSSLCYNIESFGINVIAAPDLSPAQDFILCDTDYDNIEIFNLENADYINNDRIQDDIEVHYFENEGDTSNNSLSIPNPTTYPSTSQTVYIKVTNTFTTCYTVIPLNLIVNPTPIFNDLDIIRVCDNDTDTVDLNFIDNQIVDDASIVNISYHLIDTDALNNLNPIPQSLFNYNTFNNTLHARIENINTGCIITETFLLEINPIPVAGAPTDLEDCDDDFDGFLEFDLTQNDTPILNGLSSDDYNVYYYNTDISNAENDTNRLAPTYSAVDGEIIYARLVNKNVDCYDITQFTIYVNPKPIIPLEDLEPLCINDLPMAISAETGNPGDIYEWDNGSTQPQITFNITDLGDHWVRVITPNGCEDTKYFTLIESEQANINFTTTVNFADPNSITVDISGIGDYVFILDEHLGGLPQESNIFEDVSFGRHIVTIRDLKGCLDVTGEVIVFDAPKFVTPNNDSYFDTWHIIGVEDLPGTVIYIFNRHGKLLKTLSHTSRGWDGTFNGQNMPSDDYWFSADIVENGESYQLKGHFALKR